MDAVQYGELMRRRALGLEPEMESAKQLVRILQPIYRPGMTVLDVGCGCGHFLRSLRGMDPGIRYTGIDSNLDYIMNARQIWGDKASFEVGDINRWPVLSHHADIVVCITVIQNLDWVYPVLGQLTHMTNQHLIIRTLLGALTMRCNRDEPHPIDIVYNIYAEDFFVSEVICTGFQDVQVLLDECNIDLPRTSDPTQTYTIRTDDGRRLQVNGNLLLNWRWVVASR